MSLFLWECSLQDLADHCRVDRVIYCVNVQFNQFWNRELLVLVCQSHRTSALCILFWLLLRMSRLMEPRHTIWWPLYDVSLVAGSWSKTWCVGRLPNICVFSKTVYFHQSRYPPWSSRDHPCVDFHGASLELWKLPPDGLPVNWCHLRRLDQMTLCTPHLI